MGQGAAVIAKGRAMEAKGILKVETMKQYEKVKGAELIKEGASQVRQGMALQKQGLDHRQYVAKSKIIAKKLRGEPTEQPTEQPTEAPTAVPSSSPTHSAAKAYVMLNGSQDQITPNVLAKIKHLFSQRTGLPESAL